MFVTEFLDYFKEGNGYTSMIVSLLVGVTLCSGPISSAFVNRYGCRPVTIAGTLLASTCIALSYFAQNILTLIFTIGIGAGFGFGLIYLPAIVSVTMYFEKYRSLATGIAVCGSGLGTFIFSPLSAYLIETYGWRGTMLIIGGITLNCIIFGATFKPLQSGPAKLPENTLSRSHSVGQQINGTYSNESINSKVPSIDSTAAPNGIRTAVSHQNITEDGNKLKSRSASGTMYRPDILYQGSLASIPDHATSRFDVRPKGGYGSLRRTNNGESQDFSDPIDEGFCQFYWPSETECEAETKKQCKILGFSCSPETRDTFDEMMDFELFKDWVFIIFVVSNFCTSIGFNVPYVYLPSVAKDYKLSITESSTLLGIIGIANTVGRIILGYFSDKAYVNRLLVYNICLTVCGISTVLSVFCVDFMSLAVYSAFFGFTIGAYVGLTSVILVDLLGLDKLTNAFGLLLLFQGIASLAGPPLAGWISDQTGSYTPGFLLAGIMIIISGVILFLIPPLQKYYAKRNKVIENNNVS
uniref:Major facilitator superfamily (MFS) profile domain-containing protein n=1 Tax=Megaselia scalaris TaxID=36166 RepID=T1GDJ5_MEGSC